MSTREHTSAVRELSRCGVDVATTSTSAVDTSTNALDASRTAQPKRAMLMEVRNG